MSFSGKLNSLSVLYMLGNAGWNVFKTINTPSPDVATSDNPYRPSEWVNRDTAEDSAEDLVYLIPNISETQMVYLGSDAKTAGIERTNGIPSDQSSANSEKVTVGYFFDAFIREGHEGAVRITEHPVQDGTNISDHAYNFPDKLSLEIFVSDSMDEVVVGQFSEYDTKSISAYQILRALKEQRMPLSINTSLHYYENMLIEHMSTYRDHQSANSLKCTAVFKQIRVASIAVEVVSIKPQATDVTKKASVNSGAPQTGSFLENLTREKKTATQESMLQKRYGR